MILQYVSTIEALLKECDEIQQILEAEVSPDINALLERGNILIVQMARTGKMLSDAKYLQDIAINKSILNEIKGHPLAPSVAKMLIDSSTKNENFLVSWCDRLNRSCTHQIEYLRSAISKEKEEMRLSGYHT